MKTYCVLLNGRNFLMSMNDIEQKFGFYSSKVVKASNEKDAELKAVEMVRSEKDLKKATRNMKDDPPMIYLEDIRVITDQEAKEIPTKGHTFYPESQEEDNGTPNQAL